MSRILALVRVSWLTFVSYRMNLLFTLAGLAALFVPIYFVAPAIQSVAGPSIADEGGQYFGFVILGIAVMQVVNVSMRELPNAISGGISSGTLESLFATPTPLPVLLIGMVGHGMLWGVARCALLVAGFALTGGSLVVQAIPFAASMLLLLVLAHSSIGLLAAAMILLFRAAGPLVAGATIASSLLGGVYYSTGSIPESVRPLAGLVPLAHGLRAIRRTLLEGTPVSAVWGDVAALVALTVVLLAASLSLFAWSLRRARRAGSLSQY